MSAAARLGPEATWEAMAEGAVAFEGARDVVAVEGRDARSWLQGQLSQDIEHLAAGETTEALLLSPEGRMVALLRVTCDGDRWLLDADAGAGEAVLERLRRFRLRVKAEIELLDWQCVALRGPGAAAAAGAGGGTEQRALPWSWAGDEGWDLVGPQALVPDGVAFGDPTAAAAARIAAGVPRLGSELLEKTLPHEVGLVERAVSFDKGCYTGQELVARLDSRGARVPHRLRGVVLPPAAPGAAAAAVGDELRVAEKVVGRLTSVAISPRNGHQLALAFVRREVEPPADAVTDAGPARVEPLPLLAEMPAPVAGSAPPPAGSAPGG